MGDSSSEMIDELDRLILIQLQDDGRKSFTDIAKTLNISVGTVRNRVTRMLEDGTVRIIGRVNPHRVGFRAPATINVTIQPHLLEQAAKEIARFREVSYVALVAGDYNLVVDVMCRDGNHLADFLLHRLPKVEGVVKINPAFVLHIQKYAQSDLHLLNSDFMANNNIQRDNR